MIHPIKLVLMRLLIHINPPVPTQKVTILLVGRPTIFVQAKQRLVVQKEGAGRATVISCANAYQKVVHLLFTLHTHTRRMAKTPVVIIVQLKNANQFLQPTTNPYLDTIKLLPPDATIQIKLHPDK